MTTRKPGSKAAKPRRAPRRNRSGDPAHVPVRDLTDAEKAFAQKRHLELAQAIAEMMEAKEKAQQAAQLYDETILLITGDPELGIDPQTWKVVRKGGTKPSAKEN